ncbi:MAG: cadmium-translocating P-type ATPase [Clostridia bacterium]|nr:cadmium-translocating P-type ATPase [Clostridia bacterium]
MTKKQKRNLKRIVISLVLFLLVKLTDDVILTKLMPNDFPNGIASIIPDYGWIITFALYFGIYVYIGYDVIRKAVLNIINGQVFDENFLMSVATIGAFGLGIYTSITTNGINIEGFDEACAVLLFYQVGEWFQSYAVGKSRKSIASLMDIRPDYANLKNQDGIFEEVDPSLVNIGDIIQVKPGEKIPLDGIVINGNSSIDTKALTGESLPQEVGVGSNVISGTVNLQGTIEVKVEKAFYDSTVSKILDLVENASSQKSKSENFISVFAKYYTPIVVISAVCLAVIPSVIKGLMGDWGTWSIWIYRALSFLVVSCPCALVISIPLSFFAGLGGSSKYGILVKGSIHLERFNKANIFVFDKTGTLTKGNFAVVGVYPEEKREEILRLAAIAESQSSHPIAKSIIKEYENVDSNKYVLENISGKGIKAVGETEILCGNEKLMELFDVNYIKNDDVGTIVYVANNNQFVGSIVIADEIKPEAKEMISYLNSIGAKTVMLTGDNEKVARHVAKELGLTEFKSSLLPQNKVEEVDKLLASKDDSEYLCFVGDGINDAPVLMKSDIGISMGGVGSDAAIEASDIVLMHDDLSGIAIGKKIAKKTMKIVKENIVFALLVKVIILILSALGFANMWIAVFGDVGVAVIAIINAMRASRIN